jgi:hypothetical protein
MMRVSERIGPMTSNVRLRVILLGVALAAAFATAIPRPITAVAATATADATPAEAGASIETAVKLEGIKGEASSVHAEYVYIRERYPGWRTTDQYVLNQAERIYDRIDIIGPQGEKKSVYFDITDWFGKLD